MCISIQQLEQASKQRGSPVKFARIFISRIIQHDIMVQFFYSTVVLYVERKVPYILNCYTVFGTFIPCETILSFKIQIYWTKKRHHGRVYVYTVFILSFCCFCFSLRTWSVCRGPQAWRSPGQSKHDNLHTKKKKERSIISGPASSKLRTPTPSSPRPCSRFGFWDSMSGFAEPPVMEGGD